MGGPCGASVATAAGAGLCTGGVASASSGSEEKRMPASAKVIFRAGVAQPARERRASATAASQLFTVGRKQGMGTAASGRVLGLR